MSNLTITNNNVGNVILKDGEFKNELLVFAGAGTVLEGTILARRLVALGITPVADGGNTGNGTVTAATVVAGTEVPKVGSWNLELVEVIAEGGVFKLEDPDGNIVAGNLILDPAGEASTVFQAGGMQFTVNEGSTDFALVDKFSLPVVADGKMVPYAIAGAGGAQVPNQVLTYDVVAAGAGNESIRGMISGQVRSERLIIDADGDGSNITDAILDELRENGLVPVSVTELNIQDNQ